MAKDALIISPATPLSTPSFTPSGNDKELDNKRITAKHSAQRIKHVDYTATNRKPGQIKND